MGRLPGSQEDPLETDTVNNLFSPAASRVMLLYLILIGIFLFTPIVFNLYLSFSARRFPGFPVTDYSLKWYLEAFHDARLTEALIRTLIVSSLVAPVATLLGGLAAYADYRFKFFGKRLALALGLLPPTIPIVILGLAFLAYLARFNLTASLTGVVISHIVICIPFAMALIRLRLAQMDRDLEPAAWNLGGSQFQVFWAIVIPFCLPAIMASLLLTFAVSFDEFTIAWFIGGTEQTLPVRVLNMVEREASPMINVIGTITFTVTLTLVGIALILLSLSRLRTTRASR